MAMSDDELSEAAEAQSHSILGRIRVEPGRHLFPLAIETSAPFARHRVALIGEAAHVLPPIGAQGLNMGLRDAADIAAIVGDARAMGEIPARRRCWSAIIRRAAPTSPAEFCHRYCEPLAAQ